MHRVSRTQVAQRVTDRRNLLKHKKETMLPNQTIEPQEIEALTDGCVNARRDYILGLWAGHKMGLCGDDLQLYVRDVLYTDRMTPGADPMINKVARDFSNCGVALANSQIMIAFQNAERTARTEMLVTD